MATKMSSGKPAPSGLEIGDKLEGDFEVGPVLGQGTFSVVFEATYQHRNRCALKVDRIGGPRPDALKWESNVLELLQQYPFFARHYGFYECVPNATPDTSGDLSLAPVAAADVRPKVKVLAMQMLGDNVSILRRREPGEQLPLLAALYMCEQMLFAVEALHSVGYVHRDVKPSNFSRGLGHGANHLFCFDFGQIRQYVFPGTHRVRPPREQAEFRGTSLYSSIHAHASLDLGRRDDMWSWLYLMVDLARGGLPWRVCKDSRRRCEALKRHYMAHPAQLFADLPGSEHFMAIHAHLQALAFEDKPDYGYICRRLHAVQDCVRAGGQELARLRVPYVESEELKRVLVGMGEGEGEGGAGTVLVTARDLSPPLLRTGSITPSTSASDASLVSYFDCRSLRTSVDGCLHSRGGAWGDHVWDGPGTEGPIPLMKALHVLHNGEPSPEARHVFAALMAARDVCEQIVARAPKSEQGVEDEEDEEAGSDADAAVIGIEEWSSPASGGASDRYISALTTLQRRSRPVPTIGGRTAPRWLIPHHRAVSPTATYTAAASALSESYADRSTAWLLMDCTRRLRLLHNECVWAAAREVLSEAEAVAEGDADESFDRPAKRSRLLVADGGTAVCAAVSAYISAWVALARTVLGRLTMGRKDEDKITAGGAAAVQCVQLLLDLAKEPREWVHLPGADADADAKDTYLAAASAVAMVRASVGCLWCPPAASPSLSLAAQLCLARAESWLKVRLEGQVQVAEEGAGASGLSLSFVAPLSALPRGGRLDAEEGDKDLEEDDDEDEDAAAAVVAEARVGVQVLSSMISCLKKERERARPERAAEIWASRATAGPSGPSYGKGAPATAVGKRASRWGPELPPVKPLGAQDVLANAPPADDL